MRVAEPAFMLERFRCVADRAGIGTTSRCSTLVDSARGGDGQASPLTQGVTSSWQTRSVMRHRQE